jgi:hypothetical protein
MTAKPDKLRLFYPSRDLSAHGEPLPERTVLSGSLNTIVTNSITQESGYWDGAIGFFTAESNNILRGLFFHVQKWTAGEDGSPGTLQLTQTLPVTPVSTDQFRLFKGGKYISSQEVPGLKVSGKQPEFDVVTGTNITGIQIKKASPVLGEGTLTLNYTASTKSLQLKMGSDDYGSPVAFSANGTYVLYDVNDNGWIEVTVNYAALPTSNRTDTFTLLIPKCIFVPNIEAYDAADPNGRNRYYLIGARNISTDGNEMMSGFGVWCEQPTPTTAIIQSGQPNQNVAATIILTAAPSDWPLKGFWIHNKTKGDYRFVLNRVANKLYTKAVENMILNFTMINQSFEQNPLIVGTNYSLGAYNSAYYLNNNITLIGIIITSGNLELMNASGFLIFNKYNTDGNYIFKEGAGTGQYVATYSSRNYSARHTATLAWAVNDVLEVVSELDLAQDINGATLLDPPNEYTLPAMNLEFKPALTLDDRLMADSLEIGEQKAFWIRQNILPNVPAHEAVLGALNFSWY